MRATLAMFAAAVAVVSAVAAVARADSPAWNAEADALNLQRDDAAAAARYEALLQAKLKEDPKSYDALYRLAALHLWKGDGLPEGREKADAGKECWQIAERALAVEPKGAQALYNKAACVGSYSEAVGVAHALWEGLEGKFRGALDPVVAGDKKLEHCGPLNLLGRYYFDLPWPKHDGKRSMEVLDDALKTCPEDLRAAFYLAETTADEGQKDRAKKLLDQVDAGSDAYDPPEARRVKALAKTLRSKLKL